MEKRESSTLRLGFIMALGFFAVSVALAPFFTRHADNRPPPIPKVTAQEISNTWEGIPVTVYAYTKDNSLPDCTNGKSPSPFKFHDSGFDGESYRSGIGFSMVDAAGNEFSLKREGSFHGSGPFIIEQEGIGQVTVGTRIGSKLLTISSSTGSSLAIYTGNEIVVSETELSSCKWVTIDDMHILLYGCKYDIHEVS